MTDQKKNNNSKELDYNILIFDANIFLTGIDFTLINGIIYTTSKIIDEIKVSKYINKNRNILNRIQAAIDSKKLFIKSPIDKYIKIIESKSKETGDFNALSTADKELIALTLEVLETSNKKVIIYTNDYSMENVCFEMNIPFSPLIKEGIKLKIKWEVYCPNCSDIYEAEDLNKVCERCGIKLRRRSKK